MTKAQRIQHKIGNQLRKQVMCRQGWRGWVIQDGKFTAATQRALQKAMRPNV